MPLFSGIFFGAGLTKKPGVAGQKIQDTRCCILKGRKCLSQIVQKSIVTEAFQLRGGANVY